MSRPPLEVADLIRAAGDVRPIFRLCGELGYSLKRIAHTLNGEDVLAPQPQKGRFSRSWCVSSVRHVLLNRRYIGKTIWNTRRKLRVHGTGKRVYRPRPESEWTILDTPHLRIVSDELFATAGQRFERVKRMLGRPGQEGNGLIVSPRRYLVFWLAEVRRVWREHHTRQWTRAARCRSLRLLASSEVILITLSRSWKRA